MLTLLKRRVLLSNYSTNRNDKKHLRFTAYSLSTVSLNFIVGTVFFYVTSQKRASQVAPILIWSFCDHYESNFCKWHNPSSWSSWKQFSYFAQTLKVSDESGGPFPCSCHSCYRRYFMQNSTILRTYLYSYYTPLHFQTSIKPNWPSARSSIQTVQCNAVGRQTKQIKFSHGDRAYFCT